MINLTQKDLAVPSAVQLWRIPGEGELDQGFDYLMVDSYVDAKDQSTTGV
jgi:hypothetical protein